MKPKDNELKNVVPVEIIQNKIYLIRGRKVMLDFDLALLYGVETRILIQAIKRNARRFPLDFMYQLEKDEYDFLRSQFVISNEGRGGRRYLPYVFTEQGVAMLSSVLNSNRAIDVNILIILRRLDGCCKPRKSRLSQKGRWVFKTGSTK